MAIDLLNPLDRTSATFRSDVDALFSGGLNNAIAQMNATEESMSVLASGGAYAFGYTFDSGTAAADPGSGKLRLNSSTQNAATAMYVDPLTSGGVNIDSLFASIGANTSFTKGAMRLVKANDPTRWALFDITTIATATGYRNLAVTFRAGSSASPFVNGDLLMVFIDRVGDRAIETTPVVRLGGATISSAVVNVDFLNIFTDEFYKYEIELTGVRSSGNDALRMQLASAGAVITSASYANVAGGGAGVSTRVTAFDIASIGTGIAYGNASIDIRGARGALYTGVGVRGASAVASNYSILQEGYLQSNSAISGFRLFASTGGVNIIGGQIDIYGYRKVA